MKGDPEILSKEGSSVEDPYMEASSNGSLLSLNDLAEYSACSRAYAARPISDGTIPSFRIGSLRRARNSGLDVFYGESRLAAKG